MDTKNMEGRKSSKGYGYSISRKEEELDGGEGVKKARVVEGRTGGMVNRTYWMKGSREGWDDRR